MNEYQITPATGEAQGDRYEVINCTCEHDAWQAARDASLAGMVDVEVVRRPARSGPVWGYCFTARPASETWVIEGPEGEWLSEEQAADSVEALAVYHATGGTHGFYARQVSHDMPLALGG